MKTKGFIVLAAAVLTIALFSFLMPHESQAVPSYARQVKKPCTACHTMWANLNQYGRQFKVKAYTDVSQDWEMINKDNMNLPVIAPFSTRVIYEGLVRDSQSQASSSSDVGQVAIFMAARVFDYAGVFTSAEADGFSVDSGGGTFTIPTVKMAFQYPLGEGNTLGLVAFAGLATAADPFNSLGGRDRDLIYDDGLPFILNTGWTFNFWGAHNQGAVLHGYFLGNRLYAAYGMMRGGEITDGSLASPPAGTLSNNDSTDPFDMYSRVAWDQKLSNGAVTFGLVNYYGTQRITMLGTGVPLYDSKVTRTYVDLSLEQNYGEDHMVELQALYGGGNDKNVFGNGEERKFDGWYAQADYYYDRTIGVIGVLNYVKYKDVAVGDPTPIDKNYQWIVGVNYLPWLNTKITLQYSDTMTTNINGTSPTADRITRMILEMLF
ncbi:MAG TPA: hypothetical protein VEM40_02620 [Nitrospirota bacterium]|nr:hypothetical protein [Nitrospirota bacterium]